MRILGTVLFEYILGYVLQGFSFCLGIYAFCRKEVDVKQYLVSSITISLLFIVIRFLPISFGIHTILNSICIFLLGILYMKMPPLSNIIGILIILVFLLITEFGDIYILTRILGKEKFDSLMNDTLSASLIALPSSVVFALLNLVSYYFLIIRRRKSTANGEIRA